MKNMEVDEMLDNSPLKVYSSELSQDKMIIRIKKREQDIDIEGRDSSSDQEVMSYTCEFVQKVNENELEDDVYDESIESVRQDETFIYPAITNSGDEDTNDATWQPPSAVLTAKQSKRKDVKCLHLKVEKPVSKKKICKNNKDNKKISVKYLKKDHLPKISHVLEDINDSRPAADDIKSVVSATSELLAAKAGKPRKGMATPKQRLGRIIKIHKMMK